MPVSAGDKLGPHEILAPIGAGGMGQVYKGRDTRLDRIVVIKVLPPDKIADPEHKQRFRQEAKAASSLNHPNIITIYDIGSENGIDYLAMEFVAGKTLDQLTPRNGMRIGDLLAAAVQVADALARAHQAGIVHRDLKPSNVMVSSGGLVKVLDFGLAKLMQPATGEAAETKTIAALTSDGAILGTAYYMSPEQAEAKLLDARSDIFSFGVMLYEMATGQRPFQGQSQTAVLAAILREEPKAVGVHRVDLPGDLTRIITRCLRKDPARRFQHMDDLKVALEELKEESDSGKLSASVPGTNLAPAGPSGKKRIWIAAAAMLLFGTAIAGWRLNRGALSATDAPPTPIPLTSYRGSESNASFSPDGNQVAFSWDCEKENVFDVYVKLIGPGGALRLTNSPEKSVDPKKVAQRQRHCLCPPQFRREVFGDRRACARGAGTKSRFLRKPQRGRGAEFDSRPAASLGFGHARGQVLPRLHFEVPVEFFVQLAFDVISKDNRSQSKPEIVYVHFISQIRPS